MTIAESEKSIDTVVLPIIAKNVGDDLFEYELAYSRFALAGAGDKWPPVRAGRHHCPEARSPAEDRGLRSPEPPQAESIASVAPSIATEIELRGFADRQRFAQVLDAR
jgi:hypothetical protein